MPLVVRRVKVMDLPALEQLERETVKRLPARAGWLTTYRRHAERALSEEPEGILVAEYDGRVVGGVIVRQFGPHPVTGEPHGRVLSLSVAAGWRKQGVEGRLLREAEAYLKSRGCESLSVTLQVDAGDDHAEALRTGGYEVAAWELSRPLT